MFILKDYTSRHFSVHASRFHTEASLIFKSFFERESVTCSVNLTRRAISHIWPYFHSKGKLGAHKLVNSCILKWRALSFQTE